MIVKAFLIVLYTSVLYNFIFLDIGNIYNLNFPSLDFLMFIWNLIVSLLGIISLWIFQIKDIRIKNNSRNTFYSIICLYIYLIVWFFISQEYLIANRDLLTVTKLSWYLSFLFLSLWLFVSPVLFFIKNVKLKLFLILSRKLLWILVCIILIRHIIDFFVTHYPWGTWIWDYWNYFISQIENPVIWSGTVGAVIILLLGLTSNKFSCMKMRKWWKKLHLLVFPAYVSSMLHIWYLDRIDWFYGSITLSIIIMRAGVYILKINKWKK